MYVDNFVWLLICTVFTLKLCRAFYILRRDIKVYVDNVFHLKLRMASDSVQMFIGLLIYAISGCSYFVEASNQPYQYTDSVVKALFCTKCPNVEVSYM